MDRETLRKKLMDELRVERSADNTRLVTLRDVVVGRLGQRPEDGAWVLEIKAEWRPNTSELEQGNSEVAELWAVEEVADWYALERAEGWPPGVHPQDEQP